jgi:tRNA(Arg) A34 adenosine deaminase TadA
MTTTPPDDMFLLRQTLGIARQARRNGKHPFGALLAGPDGAVLMWSAP